MTTSAVARSYTTHRDTTIVSMAGPSQSPSTVHLVAEPSEVKSEAATAAETRVFAAVWARPDLRLECQTPAGFSTSRPISFRSE